MADRDSLILNRETIGIEGGRDLYNYTFREATSEECLQAMMESGEFGAISDELAERRKVDLQNALAIAVRTGNIEATRSLIEAGAIASNEIRESGPQHLKALLSEPA